MTNGYRDKIKERMKEKLDDRDAGLSDAFNEGYEDAAAYVRAGETVKKKDVSVYEKGSIDGAYWLGWNQAIEEENPTNPQESRDNPGKTPSPFQQRTVRKEGEKEVPEGYDKTVEILRGANIPFNLDELGKDIDQKDTILSASTATDWDIWECTRELVQNALDEHTELGIDRPPEIVKPTPRILKIRDYGNGLEYEDIIYNRPVKGEEETLRGMYGTGFKRSFIRLLEGFGITPILVSTNYSIVNQKFSPWGEGETWSFTVDNGLKFPDGTIVMIEGEPDLIDEAVMSIREKVLDLPMSKYTWKKFSSAGGLVKNKSTGEYLKGTVREPTNCYLMSLFVEQRDTVFGYNFLRKDLPSDDSRTAFADSSFKSELGEIIEEFDESPVIRRTIKQVFDEETEFDEEEARFSFGIVKGDIAEPDMWLNAWQSVFSKRHVLLTNSAMTEEVMKKGYHPVPVPSSDWKRFLKACEVATDEDIIGQKGFKADLVKPTEGQKKALKAALTFLDPFYSVDLKGYFEDLSGNVYKDIVLFSGDKRLEHDVDNVKGFVPWAGSVSEIHIDRSRLKEGVWPTVSTLFHEIGHTRAVEGGRDKTRAFERYLQNYAIRMGRALSEVSKMGLEANLPDYAEKLPGTSLEFVKDQVRKTGVGRREVEDLPPSDLLAIYLTTTSMEGVIEPHSIVHLD